MNLQQEKIANRLREVLVEKLKLPMKPEEISYEMELFNEGLGLDSVDALEIVATVDEEYGVALTTEHRDHFKNIEKLSKLILKLMEEKNEKSS